MKDQSKTKQVLIQELVSLRQKIAELERSESERKQAEEALLISEREIHDLYDNSPCGYHSLDKDGLIIRINDTELNWLGYSRDEVIGKMKLSDLLTSKSAEDFKKNFPLFKERGWAQDLEYELVRKDGTILPVLLSATAIKDIDGNYLMSRSILYDIADLKQVENTLRDRESKFRILIETTRDIIYTTDRKGFLTYLNPTLERALGYAHDEWNGKSFAQIIAPEHIDVVRDIFRKAMKGESIPVYEADLIRKDGTRLSVEFNVTTLLDKKGKFVGRFGIGRDITERKRVEEALQKAKEMLVQSEKLAALAKLTDGASHEILNPLNILSLRLQFLEMTETLSENTKEAIKVVKAQIGRIVKITHSISEFSRTTALHVTTVDLKELMGDVFLLTAPQLKKENVTFNFQYQADIPSLLLDKFRIEQCILNFINNAIDAMKDRKEKILRVSAALDSSEEKKSVRISFSDNGTGIKAENMKRIFEPFFTTKGPDKGKGLGLSVCYGIIQDHGGTIRAENNEQGGATFVIELPV